MTKYEIERLENEVSRQMRNHPGMTMMGLLIIVSVWEILSKPVLAYTINALGRAQYKSLFLGREGTYEAIQTWNELIAELNAISDMGIIGEMLVTMPSIFRVITMVVTGAIFFLMLYFAFNMWEAMQDHHKEIEQAIHMIVEAMYIIACAMWRAVCLVTKGLRILLENMLVVLGAAGIITYYGVRRMFRRARKMFRRWMRKQEAKRYHGRFEAK